VQTANESKIERFVSFIGAFIGCSAEWTGGVYYVRHGLCVHESRPVVRPRIFWHSCFMSTPYQEISWLPQ
jgi:hypothetical protein